MLSNHLLFLFLSTSCWLGLGANQCDLFRNGLICSIDSISDLVGSVSDLQSELECQQECGSNVDCNFFVFETFTNNRPSDCLLLNVCNTNEDTPDCENTPGCNRSVIGPKTPSIIEACCGEFQDATCEGDTEIGHFSDVAEAKECQSLCRDTSGCHYWSLFDEICFLYSACTAPSPCSSTCTSGSAFPDLSYCGSKDIFDTLLLGGETSSKSFAWTTSVELITSDVICNPQMEELPVARWSAAAAVLGSKIFYCGGRDGQDHNSCHSFDLDTEGGGGWQDEASMVLERSYFGLSAIGDTLLIASGGIGNGPPQSSVEVFTVGEAGWRLEANLEMGSTKRDHCSAAIGTWLFIIGGMVDGTSYSDASNLVEAFDTSLMSTDGSWVKKGSMNEKRLRFGCHVGAFEGQEGIYVAGGRDANVWMTNSLSTAEFYNPAADTWQAIGYLKTGRDAFPMTMLGENLIVTGGYGEDGHLTSVETWNGSSWVELNNLKMWRMSHAAVSIKAGKLSCI